MTTARESCYELLGQLRAQARQTSAIIKRSRSESSGRTVFDDYADMVEAIIALLPEDAGV